MLRKAVVMGALLMALAGMSGCSDSDSATAVSSPTWLPASGHLFDGVEVYKGPEHQDIGLIAGGTHGITFPRNDGSEGVRVYPVLVVYKSDSSRHWMGTTEFNAEWFVRSDDPRINSGQLTMLDAVDP